MSDNVSVADDGSLGRLSFPGKILHKLLSDDQFYRDVVKSNRLSISNFPKYDQWTSESGFYMEFALAGFSKDDVNISCEGNLINISSENKVNENEGSQQGLNKGMISRGIARRSFKTSFFISPLFDTSRLSAKMREGLLTIHVPRLESNSIINVVVE